MILSPLQNEAIFKQNWFQKRPRISQNFGENPDVYKQFGMKGHNGIDFAVPIGTKIFAPISGKVQVFTSSGGYGRHIRIRGNNLEIILAHLSIVTLKTGDFIKMGDFIGLSGNSGFSTGPHLHLGVRRIEKDNIEIFQRSVVDYDNGYKGYIDILFYIITWKGGFVKNSY